MKQFSTFSGLIRAPLFLKSFYVDVGQRWRGVGVLYLLLLEVLTWLVAFAVAYPGLSNFVSNELPTAIKDFPPITLKGGIASSPVAQPYIMHDSHGNAVFVLDTTGATTSPAAHKAMFMVTETEYVQDDGRGMVRRNPLKAFPDGTYDKARIEGWARVVRNLFIPVGVPAMALMSGVGRFIYALLLAALGLAFNAGFGGKLNYAALLRLAIISMTGPMLINTAMIVAGLNFGCVELPISIILTIGYLIFGVKVNADATRPVMGFPVQMGTSEVPPPEGNQPRIY